MPSQRDDMKGEQWLTTSEVREFFGGISLTTLHKGIRQGRFPAAVRLGQRVRRWRKRECETALAALMLKGEAK